MSCNATARTPDPPARNRHSSALSDLREQLGLTSSTPNASTLGRLLARLDGEALDDAVGAWLARYAADPVDEPGDTLVFPAVVDLPRVFAGQPGEGGTRWGVTLRQFEYVIAVAEEGSFTESARRLGVTPARLVAPDPGSRTKLAGRCCSSAAREERG